MANESSLRSYMYVNLRNSRRRRVEIETQSKWARLRNARFETNESFGNWTCVARLVMMS